MFCFGWFLGGRRGMCEMLWDGIWGTCIRIFCIVGIRFYIGGGWCCGGGSEVGLVEFV